MVCCLITKKTEKKLKNIVKNTYCDEEKQIFLYFLYESNYEFSETANNRIFNILNKILQTNEFEIFESKLSILNLINSNDVLLNLAIIYYENNFYNLAIDNVFKSIKEFNLINNSGLNILNKRIIS